jgi:hypothetical protein
MLRTFILFLLFSPYIFGQKNNYTSFSGALTYKVELVDSTCKKGIFQYYMRVYTNDTLIRTENESDMFGKQILIKHLQLKKQYLLLTYENKKYAIQQQLITDTIPSKYTFEFKTKHKKFAKQKSFLAITSFENYPFKFNTYYTPSLNPIYLDILKGIKGLPTQYYLPSNKGILRYTLVEVEKTTLPKNTFLFSKDYFKISFDEFINIVTGSQKTE